MVKQSLGLALLLFSALPAWAGGTVSTETFYSQALGVNKAFRIYLPEGYAQSNQRYPVIYLLHGLGVTETEWTEKPLDLAGTADAIKLRAIVVMPDGDRGFYANSVTPVDYEACLHDTEPKHNKNEKREECASAVRRLHRRRLDSAHRRQVPHDSRARGPSHLGRIGRRVWRDGAGAAAQGSPLRARWRAILDSFRSSTLAPIRTSAAK